MNWEECQASIKEANLKDIVVGANITQRPEYTRDHYEYYRPGEVIPSDNSSEGYRKIMAATVDAYERIGIVRSIVDLMSEFCVEGISIEHPDKKPNEFYKAWFKRAKIADRAERFSSWLAKNGNVVVRRRFGRLNSRDVKSLKEAAGTVSGRIPLSYVFYDPKTVDLIGGSMSLLSTKKRYGLRVPLSSLKALAKAKDPIEKQSFEALPDEVQKAILGITTKITTGTAVVPIPEDSVFVGHYKKDDTDLWAKSFIYSILGDIFYNDKIKLAKTSTLDSMINVIRLWKLGDHTKDLFPDPAMGAKLAGILANNAGGGAFDIIWNSAIQLDALYPPIKDLVGFEENTDNIFLGLGIPRVLAGGEGNSASNLAAATIGLKNLVKRIETIRRVLTEWLEEEITIIQQAMGFKRRPRIRFSHADLQDERTYYNLLIQLVDRNILSDDRILEIIKELPDIERIRIKEQESERDQEVRPQKAGAYHNPQLKIQHEHENSNNLSKQGEIVEKPAGRPPGSRDSEQRRRGPNKVQLSRGELLHRASHIYDEVDKYVTNVIMQRDNVDNLRKLSSQQKNEIDEMKSCLFPLISPNCNKLTDDIIRQASMSDQNIEINNIFDKNYKNLYTNIDKDSLTKDFIRTLNIQAYVETWGIDSYEDI